MPKEISSPFTPGLPVPVEFFVGRIPEIQHLRRKLETAQRGRLQVAYLSGERGLGKTSLASFVSYLSEQENNMIGFHAFLGGVTSLDEMVHRIFNRLLRESIGKAWDEQIKKFFGDHVRKIGLFGISVEFGAPPEDLKRMVRDFAPAIRQLIDRLREQRQGLFIILDDINGLAESGEFADWLKSLVDYIATRDAALPVCILLVGLEERRQSLIELQPSLARVFDLIEIRPWSQRETTDFYRQAFASVKMDWVDDALDQLARYAGGLPVFAHEIGDAAFNIDTDNKIDRRDAIQAVIVAVDIIGRKFLQPQVYSAIRSTRYRSILRKLAGQLGFEFKRADALAHLTSAEERVFDNFLRRMGDLGVLRKPAEKGPGTYAFTNLLYWLYFSLEAASAGFAETPTETPESAGFAPETPTETPESQTPK